MKTVPHLQLKAHEKHLRLVVMGQHGMERMIIYTEILYRSYNSNKAPM